MRSLILSLLVLEGGTDTLTGQTDWKAANIYLDCGNQSRTWSGTALPSGIEWRPLAIENVSSGPDICYNRLSAAIRFTEDDFLEEVRILYR